ncbi:MAG: hypothetical protein Q8M24_06050 [Pseudolabrys sp.]|nr:hypothetical protein [Pseudolabrys sp.]MDP2295009.1 hypothetical protein [Pseudolabrys sp.]
MPETAPPIFGDLFRHQVDCHGDDGQIVTARGANLFEYIDASHAGHRDIEKDQIDTAVRQPRQAFEAIGAGRYAMVSANVRVLQLSILATQSA